MLQAYDCKAGFETQAKAALPCLVFQALFAFVVRFVRLR
jgi:hypothetical protein